MKQQKGYWYMKSTNRSVDYKSTQQRSGIMNQDINKISIFSKQHQNNVNQMQKKLDLLDNSYKKIMKIQQFYQLMCSGQYGNMGIRCFQHNNQLIFYCSNDHKLLCANCMYATRQPQPKSADQQSARSHHSIEGTKKNHSKNNENKHSSHDVKQINKAIKQITTDISTWQSQYKLQVTRMNDCKIQWQKLKHKFEKSKNSFLSQLDKQYDKFQMKISKQYLQTKQQINHISQISIEYLDKIINYYKTISKLILPNRYPVPTAKQSWLYLMKNSIFDTIPMKKQKIPNQWHKIYTGRSKLILKKFLKGKVHSTEQS